MKIEAKVEKKKRSTWCRKNDGEWCCWEIEQKADLFYRERNGRARVGIETGHGYPMPIDYCPWCGDKIHVTTTIVEVEQ